jgi:ATP-dependent Clp protease ATP-binding subunit ClpA
MSMFERFTDRARNVVVLAQDEARGLRHGWIGTEHLLLGLLREGTGVGWRVLDRLGVGADDVHAWIRRELGEGRDQAEPSDANALRAIGIDVDEVRRAVEEAFGPGALERAAGPRGRGRIGWRRRARPFRLGAGNCHGDSGRHGHIPFTRRSKKVLELSLREAVRLGHRYIGTEHVLLGLVREGEGLAATFLHGRGLSAEVIRSAVIEELRSGRGGDWPGQTA